MDLHHVAEAGGILVAALFLYSYVSEWLPPGDPRWTAWRAALLGAAFGGVTVALMIARITVAPGVHLDARVVPVALVGLFEGWAPALIAAGLGAVYRASMGGGGMWAGMAQLLLTAAAGGVVHARVRRAGRVHLRHVAALTGLAYAIAFLAHAALGRGGLEHFAGEAGSYAVMLAAGMGLFAHLFRDVAERQQLQLGQQRFRAILDEASDAILIVDGDTRRIIDVNRAACELAGRTREEMLGRDERDLWPADAGGRARHEAVIAEARARGIGRAWGVPDRAPDGGARFLDTTRRLVEYRGRRYEIALARDAAERLAAERSREEAAELRTATLMARATAHEINNPLAVLMASLQLLEPALAPGSREAARANLMRDAAGRIRDAVIRLTRVTRIVATEPTGGAPPMLDTARSAVPSDPPASRPAPPAP